MNAHRKMEAKRARRQARLVKRADTLRPCPRCGEPGGLIRCEKCHPARAAA
jgi:hypothetical protein